MQHFSSVQGDKIFLKVAEILSLAPEWYPNGLVSIELDVASLDPNNLARPTSFDGLRSPLWVQHPLG